MRRDEERERDGGIFMSKRWNIDGFDTRRGDTAWIGSDGTPTGCGCLV
jgi:hypothetical protein